MDPPLPNLVNDHLFALDILQWRRHSPFPAEINAGLIIRIPSRIPLLGVLERVNISLTNFKSIFQDIIDIYIKDIKDAHIINILDL